MRREMRAIPTFLTIATLGAALGLAGCASSGSEDAAPEGGASAESTGSAEAAKPPASSPLSKVEIGMNDTDVRNVLGNPDRANAYVTGKAWIPFYFGGDTTRTDWIYSGQGRVVFSRNQWSGALRVIRVDYDPSL